MKSWYFEGNITTLNVDFFDSAFTFSNESIQVSCCARDTTLTNVTCGQGTSCIGQCSAIEASLCPSGICTKDPEDCNPSIVLDEGENHGRRVPSLAALPSWAFKWCLPRCRVRYHSACCFHPTCYKRRRQRCSYMKYFTGFLCNYWVYLYENNHARQLLPETWQNSTRRVELWNAGNSNSGRQFLGRWCGLLPW